MPDLHQELAVLREFQDLIVVIKRAVFAPAVAADPHIALVIDGDAVVRIRPIVALARAAPVADEVALLVELQNGRSRNAALRSGWLGGGVDFHRLVGVRAVNNPDVVLGIHGDPDGHALNPMVGKRLGPQRIDFEARRLDSRGRNSSLFFQHDGTGCEPNEQSEESRRPIEVAFHILLLCFPAPGNDAHPETPPSVGVRDPEGRAGGDSKLFGEIHKRLAATGRGKAFVRCPARQLRARMPLCF